MKKLVVLIATTVFVVGCSSDKKEDAGPSVTVTKPTTVLSAISTKAQSAGDALGNALAKGTTSSVMSKVASMSGPSIMSADTRCNENGAPYAVDDDFVPVPDLAGQECVDVKGNEVDGECLMSASHDEYAGQLTYCALAKNTGNSDSILGAFQLVNNITCALERSGITWHQSKPSTPDRMTLTFDSNCFSTNQLTQMCQGPTSCSFLADVKAYLNPDTYYGARVRIVLDLNKDEVIDDTDMIFDSKLKAAGGVTEVAVNTVGINDPKQFDAFAAKYDATTNAFTFEGRFDRIEAGGGGGSGGWSRHIRIYADLNNSAVIMPEKVEVAYANLYKDPSDKFGTELITLRGSMTTAPAVMTAEVYSTSNKDNVGEAIDYNGLAAFNSVCYQPGDETLPNACPPVPAVTIPQGELAFFLPGGDYRVDTTPANFSEYLDNTLWWESLLGLNFTAVDLEKTEP